MQSRQLAMYSDFTCHEKLISAIAITTHIEIITEFVKTNNIIYSRHACGLVVASHGRFALYRNKVGGYIIETVGF